MGRRAAKPAIVTLRAYAPIVSTVLVMYMRRYSFVILDRASKVGTGGTGFVCFSASSFFFSLGFSCHYRISSTMGAPRMPWHDFRIVVQR